MSNSDSIPEGYVPMFELGLFEEMSPACKVIPNEAEVCPIVLAALVTVLFETVMRAVPEKNQIEFENKFHEALEIMLEERFDYDVVVKPPNEQE